MNILVTGGAGFIGSHFIIHMLKKCKDCKIVNFDVLTYAANKDFLKKIENNPNYLFVQGSICNDEIVSRIIEENNITHIVNFAAESHVDRSIKNPIPFLETNVLGTEVLLRKAVKYNIEKFIQVSTDEVYGSLGDSEYFTEESPLKPNSPYSASKASADLIVRTYYKTYGLNVNITRCSNNYGPHQHPEKLIPLTILKALKNEKIPIYGSGKNVRDWIYVKDHCQAIDLVLQKGQSGEIYNIGTNNEWRNIDLVKLILKQLGKSEKLIEFVDDRLGHDYRYAIDSSKMKNSLGWKYETSFTDKINETIEWYVQKCRS